MYFHRYIRLTPVVAVVVLYIMSLYKYSGAGPMWMKLGTQDKRCEESWWATLLYVQNYAFPYSIVSKIVTHTSIYIKIISSNPILFPLSLFSASVSLGIWPSILSCMCCHHSSSFPCGSGVRRLLHPSLYSVSSAWVVHLPRSCTTTLLSSVSMIIKSIYVNVLPTIQHIPVFQHG